MEIIQADNGLTILFRHVKSGLVDIRYYVDVGAMDESYEDQGYCHALEHMLFAGTSNRSWEDINLDLQKIGAWFNAFTWHNRTIYQVNCMKEHWKEGYEVLADILYDSVFPEERWEMVEKGAVVSEIQEAFDSPEFLLEEGMYLSSLGTEDYHPIVGSEENIRKATIEDLRKFYDRSYCGSNIVLCIAGDLNKKDLKKTVARFDRLRKQKPPKRKPFDLKFNYNRSSFKRKELEQVLTCWLKPVVEPRTTRTKMALDIGINCLSQYLFEELRERRGLVYAAKVELYWDIPGNLFIQLRADTDLARFRKTKRETEKALRDFISEGLTAQRVRNTIETYKYIAVTASESCEHSTEWMWDAWKENITEDPFKLQMGILNTLTAESVRNAVRNALEGPWKFGKMVEKT